VSAFISAEYIGGQVLNYKGNKEMEEKIQKEKPDKTNHLKLNQRFFREHQTLLLTYKFPSD